MYVRRACSICAGDGPEYRIAVIGEMGTLAARSEPLQCNELTLDERTELDAVRIDLIPAIPDQHQCGEFMGSQHFVS
jgi:hypothetical protein